MSCYNFNKRGFTLLEVLIALAVLALGLIALSDSMNMVVRNQGVQQQKTFAHYVAMYRLGEIKLEQEWPKTGTTRGAIQMLNREWRWQQVVNNTSESNLRRIDVSVSSIDDEDYQLATISSFVAKPPTRVAQ